MQKYQKVSILGYVVNTKGEKVTGLVHMFYAKFMGLGNEINNSSGSPISETVAICLKDSGEVITVLPIHVKFVFNDAENLQDILRNLREIRGSQNGEVRKLLNIACDRVDVALSKILELG